MSAFDRCIEKLDRVTLRLDEVRAVWSGTRGEMKRAHNSIILNQQIIGLLLAALIMLCAVVAPYWWLYYWSRP